ncbi:MAG TPA: tRNA (adenosine(37)-N6)-dimethylallyltransferase MiaA [Cytophagaceae bacterium]|nr:tRNA (adenosine(37)-N6)-dimethylallyltransferase MiaA [Cytophagaceae bacterium]
MSVLQNKKYLIVIAGPTAVGKTALSIRVAQHFHTEILSADSRQFYKEMNIGTAKPSAEELAAVPHHFINTLHITDEYTVGMYEAQALQVLQELYTKHDLVVLTGGSGLFIKTLCEGLDDIPEVAPSIREELNAAFKKNGLETLLEELKEKDPDYYETVDRGNPVRIIRALEICRGTGKPFSSFRTSNKKERFFTTIKIALDRPREELYKRIDLRMDQMLAEGLVEEAKNLYQYKNKNALQTVGYSEVFDFLDGLYDAEEMERLLKRNSHHYAKRQLTWFRKDKEYHWFLPGQEERIFSFIESQIQK